MRIKKLIKQVMPKLKKRKTRKKGYIKPFIAGMITVLFIVSAVIPQAVSTDTGIVLAAFAPDPGMTPMVDASFPVAEQAEPGRVMWVVVTAYSSDVAQTDSTPCIPANGYNLCEHYEEYGSGNSIAANFLRFDTQVKLPEVFGDKVFIVRDRMNARYNGQARIDVWMPTRAEAVQFGVKTLKMEIY